jgi:hypothetical protein
MQAIKPETGACSLGQDGRPKTPERPGAQKKSHDWVRFLSEKSRRDAQKEKSPNRYVFLEARKGAPTHQGRHALTVM